MLAAASNFPDAVVGLVPVVTYPVQQFLQREAPVHERCADAEFQTQIRRTDLYLANFSIGFIASTLRNNNCHSNSSTRNARKERSRHIT